MMRAFNLCNATTLSSTPGATLRINAGGPAYTDSLGQLWAADNGFNTGSVASTGTAIANTVDDALYQTQRWDDAPNPELQYSFTVPNGSYQVKLHFVETNTKTAAVGARVFDVDIEGAPAFDNVDVFAEAGLNTALVKSVYVNVADGQINILLRHQIKNPLINAIEIIGQGAVNDVTPPSIPTNLNASAVSTSQINLSWTASADSGAGIAGYRIYRDGSPIATTATTSYSNTGLNANTAYNYTVTAFDNAMPTNESLPTGSVSATTLSSNPSTVIRINAGGSDYVDSQGQNWAADAGFNTGNVLTVGNAIANTVDDALYQTQRWDDAPAPELQYSFIVPNGSYQVRLHFVETNTKTAFVGGRTFDVDIEGVQRFDNVDVFAEAGAINTALIKTTNVSVTDGQINILLRHQVKNPLINAIEIAGQ